MSCQDCDEIYCPKRSLNIDGCDDFLCKACHGRKWGQVGVDCNVCGVSFEEEVFD